MIYTDVFQLVQNTPLLLLSGLNIPKAVHIYAKLEHLNPSGDIKDRLGIYILKQLKTNGVLTKQSIIIEAAAGNTGLGLAFAARKYDINTPNELGIHGAIEKATQHQYITV